VVGCGDEDRIDVGAGEQVPVFFGDECLGIGEGACLFDLRIPDIADRHNAGAGDLHQRTEKRPAASTGADDADVDRVVGGIAECCCAGSES
jgi:hypothetical protein